MLETHLRAADADSSDEPLVYALVEAGVERVAVPSGWFHELLPGRADATTNGQSSGGICIISHNSCPIERIISPPIHCTSNTLSTAVTVAVMAPHGRSRFLLAVAYVHPDVARRADCMQAVCEAISVVQADYPRLPLLVVGDFNARHPLWHDSRPVGSCNAGDHTLAEWIVDSELHVHNRADMPTRVATRSAARGADSTDTATSTATVIDLVLSQPAELVADISQRHQTTYHINDHKPFTLTLALDAVDTPPPPPPSRPRVKWATGHHPEHWQLSLPNAMRHHIDPLGPLLATLDQRPSVQRRTTQQAHSKMEEVYQRLEAAILVACKEAVGYKRTTAGGLRQAAWWTREVDELHSRLTAAKQRRVAHPDDTTVQREVTYLQREWRRTTAEAKQQASEQRATRVMDPSSKLRYATLRTYRKSPFTPLTGIIDSTGAMPTSHTQSLDNLSRAFIDSSVPPPPPPAVQPTVHSSPPAPDIDDSDGWTFTAQEVEEQTKRRTCKTSAGPDAVLPLFLRYGGKALWCALAVVFNYSWRHSVTPQAWREANVTALYKGKGSRGNPMSYRPISVTSGIARTFEHLIHTRLVPLVAPQLSPSQFGFRAHHSTSDAIMQLLTPLQYLTGLTNQPKPDKAGRRATNTSSSSRRAVGGRASGRRVQERDGEHRKLRTAALFLDIQKAFDRVDHDILLDRLHHIGVRHAALRWVRCFLTDRRMRCVDNQRESNWQAVQHGVPQGCVLSPLLFLVFINDLVLTLDKQADCQLISPTFYADDGVLGPHLGRCRDRWKKLKQRVGGFERVYADHLKAAARHLDEWCVRSRMRFGQEKTRVVVFNRSEHTDNKLFSGISLCGYQVAITNRYEYLGLTLSDDLTWHAHADSKLKAVRAAASRVTAVALGARPVQPAVVRELVRACVVPAFDYGIEFWGNGLPDATIRAFQAAVAKPLRAALGLPTTAHQHTVLWGCGVEAFATHVQHKQLLHLRRVSRLLQHDPQHPTCALYHYSHSRLHDEHGRLLGVHATLPLPVFLLNALLPFVDLTDSPACPGPSLKQPGPALPAHWNDRRRVAEEWAKAGYTGGGDGQRFQDKRREFAWTALTTLHRPNQPAQDRHDPADLDMVAHEPIPPPPPTTLSSPHIDAVDVHQLPPLHRSMPMAQPNNHTPSSGQPRLIASALQPHSPLTTVRPTQPPRKTLDPIRRVCSEAARQQWNESHMPATPQERAALTSTELVRRTTAPITRCAADNASSSTLPLPFLHSRYAAPLRHHDLVRRVRLLYNRSNTATVSHRFPSATAAATLTASSTRCTDRRCTTAHRDESIDHLLLECPRYQPARTRLEEQLARHDLPLTLANILNPPERGRREYITLYRHTSGFLASVHTTRQQLNLPDLDGCPRHHHRSPRPVSATTAPLVAVAAPLPLDTG